MTHLRLLSVTSRPLEEQPTSRADGGVTSGKLILGRNGKAQARRAGNERCGLISCDGRPFGRGTLVRFPPEPGRGRAEGPPLSRSRRVRVSGPAQEIDDFVNDPSRGWSMEEQPTSDAPLRRLGPMREPVQVELKLPEETK